ncbi:MAG: hypothetical protein JKP92_03040 [Alphaproteobacteria bacterium]|jgi:hypothetical protein|nr:hypothetical protein [Alphaproteobacteria bacterium]
MTNKEALKEVKARIEDALLKMIYADGAHSLGAHDKSRDALQEARETLALALSEIRDQIKESVR